MRFNNRTRALLDIPDLPPEAFKHYGDRRIKPQGGDPPSPSPAPATTSQTQTAELPEWARPYAKETLAKGAALTDINANPYQTYGAQRIAGFTPMQQQAQQQAQNMQPSAQLGTGTGIASLAGLGALNTEYQPGQFTNQFQAPQAYQPSQFGMLSAQAPNLQSYQMGPAERISAQQVGTPLMDAAQTAYRPDLQTFQMGPAERVRTQSFANPYSASAYMSPYMQNVVEAQQREAQRSADIAGTQRAARATQAGAFGGSRQAIENAEAARNLATQKGDIQAAGLQSAYQQAQGQFNAEQQARLQAQLANQQAGLQIGGQNLQAALGVQQLGTQTGLQTSLANLSSAQQANVQNQAAQLQTQGMNAQQAMQAALANQQAGLQVGGQNLQAALGVQQLGAGQNLQAQLANQQAFQQAQTAGEQSRQFGAGQGLQAASLGAQYGQSAQQLGEQSRQYGAGLGMQGLQTGLQAAGQLGQLGQTQYGQEMGINQLQSQYGAQQQALQQQANEMAYQNFLNQQNYPYKQLGFMSDMIRGMPLGQQSTSAIYQAPPSIAGQLAGLGTGAYGLSQLLKAEGGLTKSYADGGSVESESNISSIVSKLSDEQLNQAEKAAQARGDVAQLQIIQAERAMRASERGGMAGAFNQLPEEQQQMMAKGGIIAFDDGGGVPTAEEIEAAKKPYFGVRRPPRIAGEEFKKYKESDLLETLIPSKYAVDMPVSEPAKKAQDDQKLLEEAAKKMAEAEKPQQKPQLKATSTRVSTSKPPVEAPKQDGIADIYEKFLRTNKEDLDAYRAEQKSEREEQKRLMEERKKQVGMEALTRFGFQMAANASAPGATLFGSAGKASPVVADVLEQGKKLEMASLENMAKLKRDDAQFNMAVKRNDMKSALEYANVMRQDKKDQQMIELERRKLAQMASYYSQAGTTSLQKIADDLMRADPSLDRKTALQEASKISGYSFRSEGAANTKRMEQLQKIEKEYAIDAFLPPDSDLFKRRQEEKRRRIAELGGGQESAPEKTAAPQMKIVGVRQP
jgi:hypothetical protein